MWGPVAALLGGGGACQPPQTVSAPPPGLWVRSLGAEVGRAPDFLRGQDLRLPTPRTGFLVFPENRGQWGQLVVTTPLGVTQTLGFDIGLRE